MIIYKATCIINDKIYIGQTKNKLEQRKNEHEYDAFHKFFETHFHNSLRKYGIEKFKWSVIEECKTKIELNNREIYWINYYNSSNKKIGYNITKGGSGGDTYTNNPNYDDICNRKSISMLGKNKGKDNGINKIGVKEQISNSVKLLWQNVEYRNKQIKSRKNIKRKKLTNKQKKNIADSIRLWHIKRKLLKQQ